MRLQRNGSKRDSRRLLLFLLTALTFIGGSLASLQADTGKVYGNPENKRPDLLLDRLQITVSDDTVAAFSPDSRSHTIALLPGELIRDVLTHGRVGAVITSERLLATGRGGIPWMTLPLEAMETTARGFVSSRLVLFITNERVIVFDSSIPRFLISDLPVGERVDDQAVLPTAAVYITRDRAVGYSLGSSVFRNMLFAPGESLRRLKISKALISVVTSRRTLVFQNRGQWIQYGAPLGDSDF